MIGKKLIECIISNLKENGLLYLGLASAVGAAGVVYVVVDPSLVEVDSQYAFDKRQALSNRDKQIEFFSKACDSDDCSASKVKRLKAQSDDETLRLYQKMQRQLLDPYIRDYVDKEKRVRMKYLGEQRDSNSITEEVYELKLSQLDIWMDSLLIDEYYEEIERDKRRSDESFEEIHEWHNEINEELGRESLD